MLDKWFLSKMSKTGKIMYYVGQVGLLLAWVFVFMGVLRMDFDEDYIIFIVGIIPIIAIWGFISIKLWPLDKQNENGTSVPVSQQAPPSTKDPFGPNPGMK